MIAHYIYAVRIRFPNVRTGKDGWLTIGCIPLVKPRQAATQEDKTRLRIIRDSLLQLCFAVMLDSFIGASEDGVYVTLAQHGKMLALPRVVLYAADQPEQRHILGLQGNTCRIRCSACNTTRHFQAARRALGRRRDLVGILRIQLEGAMLQDQGKVVTRIKKIAKHCSALPFAPVLAAFHGLGTGTLMLRSIFGFLTFHVRCWKRAVWEGAV